MSYILPAAWRQDLPAGVEAVLRQLTEHGYAAYIVGGAVRDICAGRMPHDYDIASNARPEMVFALAQQLGWQVIDKLGHNFGVVVVVADGQPVEVASFRGEHYGADSHRPSAVWYADSLPEDLARRDFTINAMALSVAGVLCDPFGGRDDLAAGIIRTVGDPQRRFGEDALRMFRACRFIAQLGFQLDQATQAAIPPNLGKVAGLSLARVRTELEKIILGPYCDLGLDMLVKTGLAGTACRIKQANTYQAVPILPEIEHLVELPQNPQYHLYDAWQHTLAVVKSVSDDTMLRWAALLHDIGKGLPGVRGHDETGQPTDHGHDRAGAQLAQNLLMRLQFAPRQCEQLVWLVAEHMRFFAYCNGNWPAAPRWVRQTARLGLFRRTAELVKAFTQLIELCLADVDGAKRDAAAVHEAKQFGDYLKSLAAAMPVHTRDLNYQADDLAAALGDSALIGPFLKNCLLRVQDGILANNRGDILAAAARWAQRQSKQPVKQ